MTQEIRVELCYGRGEYIRAVRLYLRKSGIASRWDVLIVPLIAALAGVLIWLKGMTFLNTALVVLLVIALCMGLFVYFVQPGRVYDRSPPLRRAVTYTFTPEDIGVRGEEVMGSAPWQFTKFWSTEEFYFLVERQYRYTILPKRIFSGQEQRAHFEAMVMEANQGIRWKEYR